MISRRTLLVGGAALAGLAGCATQSKFRNYQGPQVTSIQVFKSRRKMYLMHGDKALRTFDFELGGDPVGAKMYEGDGKTPEGAYMINRRNPNSSYYLSIGISYPNEADVARATAMGLRPGGDIFIHGTPREMRRAQDWTAGCIAVTNREMEDIYAMVRDNTPIYIFP
ncbi:L,D-transpeptidase family protein [Rubellimicrobium arenae]|uniref:L,D-transpeptidase family protein n=1 Tax=Rubellimicrobium arenae TaxID=2817372 RepID=UPI001B3176E2|nr:L,D-transpeptidase family protein [Rubellimicrobium arenae]